MIRIALLMSVVLLFAACGGDDAGGTADRNDDQEAATSDEGGSDSGGDGDVVDQQPAGEAMASVDGQEFDLTESPALGCDITPDTVTFSFWVGDNSIVLGGGANYYDEDGWLGHIELTVFEPEGEDGPVSYFIDLEANGDRIATDGDSFSYSGPMLKQPPNDGSNPPPVDAGDGTFSVTCA
jgi:hypothetical protein